MAISKRSAEIQKLYADWTDGALALAQMQDGEPAAGELETTQAWRWHQLVTRLEDLVARCLRLHSPIVQQRVKEVLYDGVGKGWVIDLCEQLSPSISIRDVIKAEVETLLAVIDIPPGDTPSPEAHSALISMWLLAEHADPGGDQALRLRDQLILGLRPLLRTAARQACRGDQALAEQVESEVYTDWMEGGVLKGFDPAWHGLDSWLFGACRYRRMQMQRRNSRYYGLHAAMPVFADGSQAEPFDPDARTGLATPLRLAQLENEALPMLYADMKKDIRAGKAIVVPLENGRAQSYRLGFQHLHLLQAAQREQFDPDPGKAKHEQLSALTHFGRAKNAEDWRVAQAYVRQHPRAKEIASLLQPASTLRSLRPSGGASQD